MDRFPRQFFLERGPTGLLKFRNRRNSRVDLLHLLFRGHAVRRDFKDIRDRLLVKARDAHAIEFIEVRARNREKPHAFQKGVSHILGFFQHALIELEPRKFPIEKPFRAKG